MGIAYSQYGTIVRGDKKLLPEAYEPLYAVYRKGGSGYISTQPYLTSSQRYITNCKFIFKGAIDANTVVTNMGTTDLGIFGAFSYSNMKWGAQIRILNPTGTDTYNQIRLLNGVSTTWSTFTFNGAELLSSKELEISWDADTWTIKFDDTIKGTGTFPNWVDEQQNSNSQDLVGGIYNCMIWGTGAGNYNDYMSQIGIKYIKCISNVDGSVLFEFYPCKRKSDNKLGFYDTVSGIPFITSSTTAGYIDYPTTA